MTDQRQRCPQEASGVLCASRAEQTPATGCSSRAARPAAGTISVIIPARDEAATIGRTLDRLLESGVHEIIVADGQSADRTADIARRRGAKVVRTRPGRGRQLRAGAAVATGDIYLFLHADTLLPVRFEDHVRRVLGQPGVSAGAFRLRIGAPLPSLRVIERAVNWRARRRQLPYGDQAIFLRASTYRRAGGFPPWPAMEDVSLIRHLRRMGRIEIAPAAVCTSARRWRQRGVVRTTVLNQVCLVAWFLGVSPARIASWRGSAARRRRPRLTMRSVAAVISARPAFRRRRPRPRRRSTLTTSLEG